MSFVVTPPSNLDPLIVSFADVTTPVVHNTSTASIIRKSGRVSYDNVNKSFAGPAGVYSLMVSLFPTYAAATVEFWEAKIGAGVVGGGGLLYCNYYDAGYPADGPPIICQVFQIKITNPWADDGTAAGGGFGLTTLNNPTRGFSNLVVSLTLISS